MAVNEQLVASLFNFFALRKVASVDHRRNRDKLVFRFLEARFSLKGRPIER